MSVGPVSDEFVEIVSGLSEGDEVYVDESSKENGFAMMMPMGGPPGGGPPGGGPRR